MWDYLTGDFDAALSAKKCLNRAVANIRPGSIIVFHDSTKCYKIMQDVLPAYLETLYEKGYKSQAITDQYLQQ